MAEHVDLLKEQESPHWPLNRCRLVRDRMIALLRARKNVGGALPHLAKIEAFTAGDSDFHALSNYRIGRTYRHWLRVLTLMIQILERKAVS